MVDWRRLGRKLGIALNLRDPPNVPPYGWSYFDHLVAVYVTLNRGDSRVDAVIKKSREAPDDLTWGDIFLLESVIFSLQPDEMVARSAWILRERFREIASPVEYQRYIASGVPVERDTPAKMALLRADLARLLDVLHWYYSLIPKRERLRTSLTLSCILLVTLYTGLLAAALIWCYVNGSQFLAMLSCVLYFGIVGGFVSSQRRMQIIPSDGDPLISVFGLDSAGYYLWLSPLLGSVFAVILMLMFMGGLLQGSFFPNFHVTSGGMRQGLPFFHFTWNTVPKNAEDYAKLLIWAFLAGFAERLVPDNLDRLASKLDIGEKKAGAVPPLIPLPGAGLEPEAPREPPRPSEAKAKIAPEVIQDAMHTGEVTPKTDEPEEQSR